jgi:hypothetical protein
MQPCPTCGRVEVNPAGYCPGCGTYRGVQGYDAGQYGGHQAGGQPYGGPYQQPYGGYPNQAPQGYGYADPNYPPNFAPPPGPARRPSTVPLIVLSVVAVILVVGIVGVVLVRANESDNGGDSGTTAAGIDKCVVGKWRVVSAREKVDDNSGGKSEFTATGGTGEFRADGTGIIDYGSGVTYRGTLSGQPVTIVFSGNIAFSYRTDNNRITYSNVTANGEAAIKVNGVATTTVPLNTDADPVSYTCNGTSMTLGASSDDSVTALRKA